MTTAALTHSVAKELRALLPAWTVCAAIIAATGLLQFSTFTPLGLLVYGLGSVGLGAQLMGQEYAHRTLGLLLSQPLSRRSLLLLKLGVLAALLAALTTIAWTALDSHAKQELEAGGWALILLSALFVAPFLTMLTRSAVAGMVFTVALPGILLTLINLADFWTGGAGAWGRDGFRQAMFWRGMFVIVAAAATGSWWMFMRLEAIEGRGQDLRLPRWLSWPPGATAATVPMRRRHPMIQLVRKELHLQQMAFVMAGISALMMGAAVLGRYAGSDASEVFIPLGIVYMAAMPFLIGSMASAEERQFGTLEWHLLLPVGARTQWRVKAGVAIALALALGAGLPALMLWILNVPGGSRPWPTVAAALVLATSLSLYVSSLTTTGIRALLTSFGVAMGCIMLTPWLLMGVERLLRYTDRPLAPWWYVSEWVWFGGMSLAAGLASLLLLYFASMNHRTAERPRVQLRRQVGWMAAMAVVVVVGLAFLGVH
ncbi:MAG: hypothetical protein WD227_11000 [Vicinamibacterales bacterium]